MPTTVGILTLAGLIQHMKVLKQKKKSHQYDIHKISKMGIYRVLNNHLVDLALSIFIVLSCRNDLQLSWVYTYCSCSSLTLCILMDFPIHIDTVSMGRIGGSRGGSFEHPSRPWFYISYENEIIWSQRDQIISFSWRYLRKMR